jgi:membrane fusion protein (multidrug efflux system)
MTFNLLFTRARRATFFFTAASALLLSASACSRSDGSAQVDAAAPVSVGRENIVVVSQGPVQRGPAISGSLRPVKEASVRAQTSGALLQVFAEKGQVVGAGQAIAKIDDSAIRDSYLSAQSIVRSAEQSAVLARRNAERASTLEKAGAIAQRDLEAARNSAMSAEAQLADANSRLALARKQLENTIVRSPIRGVVSDRPANAGDIVQPGTALFTIVDPASMRLEAAVPSEQLGMLRVGAPVQFTVNGYPGRTFTGKIERINPMADPATRQVPIYVTVPNTGGQLVAGLYAQGRVASESRDALRAPVTAVDASAGATTVLRVKGGRVERVPVRVGLRDEQSEMLELLSGVMPGDTLLIGAAQSITPGTPVRIQPITDTPAAAR